MRRRSFPDESSLGFELGAVSRSRRSTPKPKPRSVRLIAQRPEHASGAQLSRLHARRARRAADESVDLIKRALEIEPDNGSYLDSLGWAYYKDGKFDLADEHLKRAADQLQTNSVVQDHYGDVLFRLGRFDEAIAAWSRALAGDRRLVDAADIDRKIRSAKQKLPRK